MIIARRFNAQICFARLGDDLAELRSGLALTVTGPALADLEGGADKAGALWAEYTACIQESRAEVAVTADKK